jgi:N-acyl-phosphatidylethanolamine-hydrolysing phospholipase D
MHDTPPTETEGQRRRAHHQEGGGFRNPWPLADGSERPRGGFLRWQWERLTGSLAPDPTEGALPLVESDIAYPSGSTDELRITWVGHATFLLQVGGWNVLTDPVWSRRASPLPFLGPARFVPPGIPFDRLPRIDAVLLSHDHYDHLDAATVRRLHDRHGKDLQWLVPLGYRGWFAALGISRVTELDWWQEAELTNGAGSLRATALPAQHWTNRNPLVRENRLWSSWALLSAGGHRVYFAGDTGFFPGFREIGERLGPFDATLLPIGAYEPRWFMRASHMNPEEATQAYRELGGTGICAAMHWGTFRLTDEDPLEPPARMLAAWTAAALPPQRLWIARHGETRVVPEGEGRLDTAAI